VIIHPSPLSVTSKNRELFTCTLDLLIKRAMRELVDGPTQVRRVLDNADMDESLREAIADLTNEIGPYGIEPRKVLRPRVFLGVGFASILFNYAQPNPESLCIFEVCLDFTATR